MGKMITVLQMVPELCTDTTWPWSRSIRDTSNKALSLFLLQPTNSQLYITTVSLYIMNTSTCF